MSNVYRIRRFVGVVIAAVIFAIVIFKAPDLWQTPLASPQPDTATKTSQPSQAPAVTGTAREVLASLPVKGRAAKTDYRRTQFGNGWALVSGCSTREVILHRDLTEAQTNEKCQVVRGVLHDSYTGKTIQFTRGPQTSPLVQIDHVVALSNAWQTGAQQLTPVQREALANDPLELIAVDGAANQAKGDGDAATWLPPNKAFRCQYVARQIAVKQKYQLWVTKPEYDAMERVLATCPEQALPVADIKTQSNLN